MKVRYLAKIKLATPGSAVRHASVYLKCILDFFNPYSANICTLKLLSTTCIYYSDTRSMYHHMVCNVPVSCIANRDRNQMGAWLDSDLIIE